jgi:hypothetical protein
MRHHRSARANDRPSISANRSERISAPSQKLDNEIAGNLWIDDVELIRVP